MSSNVKNTRLAICLFEFLPDYQDRKDTVIFWWQNHGEKATLSKFRRCPKRSSLTRIDMAQDDHTGPYEYSASDRIHDR